MQTIIELTKDNGTWKSTDEVKKESIVKSIKTAIAIASVVMVAVVVGAMKK